MTTSKERSLERDSHHYFPSRPRSGMIKLSSQIKKVPNSKKYQNISRFSQIKDARHRTTDRYRTTRRSDAASPVRSINSKKFGALVENVTFSSMADIKPEAKVSTTNDINSLVETNHQNIEVIETPQILFNNMIQS